MEPILKKVDVRTTQGKKFKPIQNEHIIRLIQDGHSLTYIADILNMSVPSVSSRCIDLRIFPPAHAIRHLDASHNKEIRNPNSSLNTERRERDEERLLLRKKEKELNETEARSMFLRKETPWHISNIDLSSIPSDILDEQRKELNAKNYLYKDEKWIIRLDAPVKSLRSNEDEGFTVTMGDFLESKPQDEIEQIMMDNRFSCS